MTDSKLIPKEREQRGVIGVTESCAMELIGLLHIPGEAVGRGETVFDEEYTFPNGNRMAVQVVASMDPASEACWSQGVLFHKGGTELGCTEVQDEILTTEFRVHDEGIDYVVKVEVSKPADFHFDFGDTNDGALGMCAVVRAVTRQEAVGLLKEFLGCGELNVKKDLGDESEAIQYCNVYLNGDGVSKDDIDEEEEIEEEVEDDIEQKQKHEDVHPPAESDG